MSCLYAASIRWRIADVSNWYRGSDEMTLAPRRVASALKLAGPSAQPRMFPRRSPSLSANIRQYSSKDRPHGTICSSVNTMPMLTCAGVMRVGWRQEREALAGSFVSLRAPHLVVHDLAVDDGENRPQFLDGFV